MNKKDYFKTVEGKSLVHEGIKNIELILENCEVLTIPRNMLGEIILKDFKKTFARTAINDISLYEKCCYVVIQIKDSSQCYEGIQLTFGSVEDKEKHNLLDRLNYNDITSIIINFLWDDESYSWSVDWKDVDNNATNSLQKTKEHFRDIWIAIGENAKQELKEYLPASQEERDFIWNMYDII